MERGPEPGRGLGAPTCLLSHLPSPCHLWSETACCSEGRGEVLGVGHRGEGPAGGKADGPTGRKEESGRSRKTEGPGCVEEG